MHKLCTKTMPMIMYTCLPNLLLEHTFKPFKHSCNSAYTAFARHIDIILILHNENIELHVK